MLSPNRDNFTLVITGTDRSNKLNLIIICTNEDLFFRSISFYIDTGQELSLSIKLDH